MVAHNSAQRHPDLAIYEAEALHTLRGCMVTTARAQVVPAVVISHSQPSHNLNHRIVAQSVPHIWNWADVGVDTVESPDSTQTGP